MKRIRNTVSVLLCAALLMSVTACGGKTEVRYNADGIRIAAFYDGEEVLMTAVESWRTANAAASGTDMSDREIVDKIIEGMILTKEAELRGIAATQKEIDEMTASAEEAYTQPEGKAMLDPYFQEAGIDFEGYLELLRQIAPITIAKQKLLDEVGREYCEKYGLEFTKVNPPEEMVEAQNDFIAQLLEANRGRIEYYIE